MQEFTKPTRGCDACHAAPARSLCNSKLKPQAASQRQISKRGSHHRDGVLGSERVMHSPHSLPTHKDPEGVTLYCTEVQCRRYHDFTGTFHVQCRRNRQKQMSNARQIGTQKAQHAQNTADRGRNTHGAFYGAGHLRPITGEGKGARSKRQDGCADQRACKLLLPTLKELAWE
jgi:hypothetical protein